MIDAPAKLNLCLYLGPPRDDGMHEICSLFQPLDLADRITVSEAERDEVVCEGVEGENLAARALAAMREAGWGMPPLRIEIEKRIPVAAGLGGGSADAAAVLRLGLAFPLPEAGVRSRRLDPDVLVGIAALLGADVPSQFLPAAYLVRGAGELLERLSDPLPYAAVLIPHPDGLATADVYAEADRRGLGRGAAELHGIGGRLRRAAAEGHSPLDYPELLVNDLTEAAMSLRPAIGDAISAIEEAGAPVARMTGSGPTAFGLFADRAAAERAAEELRGHYDEVLVTEPARGSA